MFGEPIKTNGVFEFRLVKSESPEEVDETQTELDDWKEDAQKLADWALEVYSTTEDYDLKKGIGEDIIAHYALVKKYTQV